MRKKVNYINNKTLFTSMIEYKTKLNHAKENNTPKPQVSRYIGEAIDMICNKLSTKGNFSGYSYRDDMVADGVLDCIAAVDNFDPDKTVNPFGYFTMIAWNAFLRRIEKEKKQNYIKHKNVDMMDGIYDEEGLSMHTSNEATNQIISDFETKIKKTSEKALAKKKEQINEEIDEEID